MRYRYVTFFMAFVLLLAGSPSATAGPSARRFLGLRVMPGGVVVDGRIVYEKAGVVVVPEGSLGSGGVESFDSCPSGNVCLFSDPTWGGSMVQFSSCCAWNNLSSFGFNNIASSWRNRKAVDAQIAAEASGGGSKLCLNNNAYSSTMPGGWDNVASSLRVRDAGTYC